MDEINPVTTVPGASEVVEASQSIPENTEVQASGDIQDDLSDIDAAQASGQITAAEAKELKKVLKVKVDGEEFEETVDFNDEEALKRHIQKARAFDKRSKEYSKYKADVDSLLEMLQKDPEGVLERMGVNVDEFSEKRLARKIEEMQKSPEQLEMEKMRKQIEQYENEQKELRTKAEKAEFERQKDEQAKEIQASIIKALDSSTFLPKDDPEVFNQIGQLMAVAMKNGMKDVTPEAVIPYIEKAYERRLANVISKLDDAGLEKFITKQRLDQYRLNKMSSKKPVPQAPKVVDTGKKAKDEKPKEKYRLKNLLRPY